MAIWVTSSLVAVAVLKRKVGYIFWEKQKYNSYLKNESLGLSEHKKILVK